MEASAASAPHILLSVALAGGIAIAAVRAGSLTANGALAATGVGAITLAAGWPWGLFLIVWFAVASLLSRLGRAAKAARLGDIVEKGDRRDAAQVLANGGLFAAAALVSLVAPSLSAACALAGAAALAAAGSDTAATETGTLWGGTPWSLRTRAMAAPGSSGAVSFIGTVGMLVAAALFARIAAALGLVPLRDAPIVAFAAIGGALADTVLGAWLQARRWCDRCGRETEQAVHRCGTPTIPAGGLGWLGNDEVNALCTVTAAGIALALR